ncbi:MAG TPA: DedA family protein [Candidatus Saccharimonadales bacterium]|nr:DedA family protein [Candidatus Saccharimonadales bacterium]
MFNADNIVQTGGLLAVAFMIFAESGLLIGIILPGDSLLLAAGVFAGKGKLEIVPLLILVIVAAIIGNEVGYSIGRRIGPRMFNRNDGFLFRKEYIDRTRVFFEKYGFATIVVARFIANVRTIVSAIAGASQMNRYKYFIYNVIGAVLWGGGVTLLGYWLGANVPNIDKFIIPAVIIALAILYAFTVWHLARTPERRAKLKKGLKEDWNYFFGQKKNT